MQQGWYDLKNVHGSCALGHERSGVTRRQGHLRSGVIKGQRVTRGQILSEVIGHPGGQGNRKTGHQRSRSPSVRGHQL